LAEGAFKMAVHYRTLGFVLTKEDVRETDQVFSVFTKDFGKVRVLGRAIRKINSKLRSGIDLFYLSEIEFIQGKNYKTLTDALVIEKHKEIVDDVEIFELFQKISQAADMLIKGEEKDERIFNLLNEVFSEKIGLVYLYFFWSLVSLLGYQIDLYHCTKCGEGLVEETMNFSPEHGGIICLRCSDDSIKGKIKISPETVKVLRIIQQDKKDVLNKLKIEKKYIEELNETSDSYLISF
jgi:DNA repair protein RecO (recombination protein O)